MKRIIFFVMCVTVLSQSCKQQTEKQDLWSINFSPSVNDSFSYVVTTSVNSEMEVMAQKITTVMQTSNQSHFNATKVSPNEKVFDLRFSDFEMEMLMNGKNMNSVLSDSILQKQMLKLNAVKMQLLLDDNNKIKNIRNLSTLDTTSQQAKQMSQFFTQENMQQSYQTIFFTTDKKTLKKGDKWTTNSTYNLMGSNFNANITYEFLGEKDGLAYIIANGDVKGKGMMDAGAAKFEMTLDSKLKAEMQYVIKSGYLKENISNITGGGNIIVADKPIPMKMNIKTTMQLN
jgi:hypothetical protein